MTVLVQIVSLLKGLGLYNETLIAFTSDHGEEFWEHGSLGHGQSLYNELLAVPLFIKPPLTQHAGRRDVELPVSTESLLPTLLDLCGIDFNRDALSGVSLTSLWGEDSDVRADRGVYSMALMSHRVEESVIYGGWKYVRSFDPDREELYDLGLDLLERRDLAAASPRKAAQLREMIEEHGEESKRLRAFYGLEDAKVQKDSEDTRRQLKSLGYIQ
jgi:arylsulfatase A-like enzyme